MDYTKSSKELLSMLWQLRHAVRSRFFSGELRGENMALLYLLEHGGAVTPGEIGRGLGVTMPRATALINSLEDKGLITRSHSLRDRRKAQVVLTDSGRENITATFKKMVLHTRELLEFLGEEDSQAFLRIAGKLASLADGAWYPVFTDNGKENKHGDSET